MWKFSYNLRALYETHVLTDEDTIDPAAAAKLIDDVRTEDRPILTEFEAKQVLKAYGIPVVEDVLAANEKQAVAAALQRRFPFEPDIHSMRLYHKTDVGR